MSESVEKKDTEDSLFKVQWPRASAASSIARSVLTRNADTPRDAQLLFETLCARGLLTEPFCSEGLQRWKRLNEAPAGPGTALAIAANPEGILAAETLAREAIQALLPWIGLEPKTIRWETQPRKSAELPKIERILTRPGAAAESSIALCNPTPPTPYFEEDEMDSEGNILPPKPRPPAPAPDPDLVERYEQLRQSLEQAFPSRSIASFPPAVQGPTSWASLFWKDASSGARLFELAHLAAAWNVASNAGLVVPQGIARAKAWIVGKPFAELRDPHLPLLALAAQGVLLTTVHFDEMVLWTPEPPW